MDSSVLESLRAEMEQLIEETTLFLQAMEDDTAAEKIEERNKNRQRFQRCERAENARRAARFKQYNRAAVVVRKRTRPRNREFKPP